MWIRDLRWKSVGLNTLFVAGLMVFFAFGLKGQKRPLTYFDGAYQVYSFKVGGLAFKLFDLDMSKGPIRAVYFGGNGKQRFTHWKQRKAQPVICYFAAGFSQDWETQSPPLGLCIEKGRILNRNLHQDMDGLVGIDPHGRLKATDLDHERVGGRYFLRDAQERALFLTKAPALRHSFFQTQLLHAEYTEINKEKLSAGKKASRRFLAICSDRLGQVHHIIMDLVESARLNVAALYALEALHQKGYEVHYLLNQDTGSRNIMKAFDERGKGIYSAPIDLDKASQLLVYYWDK